jgi:hypothetical protein
VRIGPEAIDAAPGTIYRMRVRHADDTGRWSRWSRPVEVEVTPK